VRGTQELKAASLKETGQYLLDSIEDEDLRISELTDAILKKAVFSRVSDIHIEATRKGSRVRFRIDGVFQDLAYLPLELLTPKKQGFIAPPNPRSRVSSAAPGPFRRYLLARWGRR